MQDPPRSIDLYSNQQTKAAPAPPKIDLNLRPDVQAAKDAYLESLTAKQRDEAAKLEAGRNKTALRHRIADLERKIVSGRIEAGLEKAAAKSEYMTEKEVAELLRKGVKYIRGLRNDNRLPYYRFEGKNGSVLYKRAEVQYYIQKVLKR
jgi:excisionase family DNA binding protein